MVVFNRWVREEGRRLRRRRLEAENWRRR
ncbi:hypothetical protein HID58_012747 [Brassica napus]|uniref:Uncharacterized protein n=1 Tax=Brassica napus TaxID=3708 RepID=A0ABQ8E1Y6_BRANA|nr:hypothetical protein HID58_012747 [Brassica napus]